MEDVDTWLEVWGEVTQNLYDKWNGPWSITVYYGRPSTGQVGLLTVMPEDEDRSCFLLASGTTENEARKAAEDEIDYWIGEFRTNGIQIVE